MSFEEELFDNLNNLEKSNNLPINYFNCINNENEIEGVYTDEIFSYSITFFPNKCNKLEKSKNLLSFFK